MEGKGGVEVEKLQVNKWAHLETRGRWVRVCGSPGHLRMRRQCQQVCALERLSGQWAHQGQADQGEVEQDGS